MGASMSAVICSIVQVVVGVFIIVQLLKSNRKPIAGVDQGLELTTEVRPTTPRCAARC